MDKAGQKYNTLATSKLNLYVLATASKIRTQTELHLATILLRCTTPTVISTGPLRLMVSR